VTWNYRLTRKKIETITGDDAHEYAIREVYYDDGGNVTSWTQDPVTFTGDSPSEVIESLRRALTDSELRIVDLDAELDAHTKGIS
jgi:hypothetical protein